MRGATLVAAALSAGVCASPLAVSAHAPLARGLALGDGGDPGVALRMPGFGFVLRADDDAPFRYACDALVGVPPARDVTTLDVPFVYGAGGVLLVGTQHGLRALDRDGCPAPASADLGDAPVALLAAHPSDPNLIYAVAGGASPGLFASTDGGARFEARATFAAGTMISALVPVAGETHALYVSELDGAGACSIAVSSDGGRTLERIAQDRPRVLLYVEPAPSGALWARTRDEASRMTVIERAPQPEGPWREALRVNFFGGFAVDARTEPPVFWAGDEGGSVLRSDDGGESFVDAYPSTAVACLAHGGDRLWACTPGSTTQPALDVLRDGDGAFEDVVALADVDALVACSPEAGVESTCAAAWREWRADVRMEASAVPPPATPPAVADAATPDGADAAMPDGTDAGTPDGAEAAPEPASVPPASAPSAPDCRVVSALGAEAENGASAIGVVLLAFVLLARPTSRTRKYGHLPAQLAREGRIPAARGCTRLPGMPTEPASAPSEAEREAPSDDALAALAQSGDVEAFALLYDRHAPSVLALLTRMLSNVTEAEDVLQDVFLEAWQAVRSYDRGRAGVRTWLLVRARSRALDRLQQRARQPRASDAPEPATAASRAAPAGAQTERQLSVRRALDGLDVAVRETLELTYYAGMTALEIAERMSVPEGTVRSRLARGLRVLSELLADTGGRDER